jgi:competence protein ComEC
LRLPAYHGRAAVIYALYYLPLAALLLALARWQPLAQKKAPPTTTQGRTHTTTTDGRHGDAIDNTHTATARVRLMLSRWPVVAGCTLAALLCVIVAHPFSAAPNGGRLRIDFLDVGQGDSALVTLPDGTTLLVDGGGRPSFNQIRTDRQREPTSEVDDAARADALDETAPANFTRDGRSVGDAVVSEYLWWRGLDHVDYLLATHADADHIDGLNDVARNFSVRAVFVARAPARRDEYARLAATLRAERVPIYLLGRGERLDFGGAETDVLWPWPNASNSAPSGNNDSLVLRLRYGARTFLLTGDMEAPAEDALVRAREDLRCDVVKVAHHGSRTSSTPAFIAATGPQLAVISVGRTSPFGHPDPAVVARWHEAGAEVLTTGRRGTITVSTDGRDLRVETYLPD